MNVLDESGKLTVKCLILHDVFSQNSEYLRRYSKAKIKHFSLSHSL